LCQPLHNYLKLLLISIHVVMRFHLLRTPWNMSQTFLSNS
jgi:hypothetical protein